MKDALSDERKTMVRAISSGVPTRFTGTREIKSALFSTCFVLRAIDFGRVGDRYQSLREVGIRKRNALKWLTRTGTARCAAQTTRDIETATRDWSRGR